LVTKRHTRNIASDFAYRERKYHCCQAADSTLAEVDEVPSEATEMTDGGSDKPTVKGPVHKKLYRVSGNVSHRQLSADNQKGSSM